MAAKARSRPGLINVIIIDTFFAHCDVHGGMCMFILMRGDDGTEYLHHMKEAS
jgi:hypothetical protein